MNISENYYRSLNEVFGSDGVSGFVTPVKQTGRVNPDPAKQLPVKHDDPKEQEENNEESKELDPESKDPKKKKLRPAGYKYTQTAGSGLAVSQDYDTGGTFSSFA
jgi:hypothetical protein